MRSASLRCAPTYKGENEVTESATYVYNWLEKPTDPFRAYLAIMSGGGIVYDAQVQEKLMRAYIQECCPTPTRFIDSAKARLCTPAGAALAQSTPDDDGLF